MVGTPFLLLIAWKFWRFRICRPSPERQTALELASCTCFRTLWMGATQMGRLEHLVVLLLVGISEYRWVRHRGSLACVERRNRVVMMLESALGGIHFSC